MSFQEKYLKYKNKYLTLKNNLESNQSGGTIPVGTIVSFKELENQGYGPAIEITRYGKVLGPSNILSIGIIKTSPTGAIFDEYLDSIIETKNIEESKLIVLDVADRRLTEGQRLDKVRLEELSKLTPTELKERERIRMEALYKITEYFTDYSKKIISKGNDWDINLSLSYNVHLIDDVFELIVKYKTIDFLIITIKKNEMYLNYNKQSIDTIIKQIESLQPIKDILSLMFDKMLNALKLDRKNIYSRLIKRIFTFYN